MKLRIGRFRFEAHSDKARVGSCGGCHWWHVQWETPGERKGHCQKMAPLTDHTGRTLFPRTRDTQYCGQFRERAEAPVAVNGGAK